MSQIPSTGGALPPLDMFSAASGLASGGPSSAESGDIFDRSSTSARGIGDVSFGGINNAPKGLSKMTIGIGVGVVVLLLIARKKNII